MNILNTALLILSISAASTFAEPFSYQGQLQDEGAPANGTYDIVFQLFDAEVGGTQINASFVLNDTVVTEGNLTAEPDFGPGAFDGSPRYLALFVRDGDSVDSYTPLLPRTPITTTPQSQYATTAGSLMDPIWTKAPGIITYGDGNDKVLINRDQAIFPSQTFGVHHNTAGLRGMIISGPTGASPYYGYSENEQLNAYTYHDSTSNQWRLHKGGTALSVDTSKNLTVTNDLIAQGVVAQEVTATNFNYPQPKVNYLSVSGNGFVSGSQTPFFASVSQGGAFISSRLSGWLVAPVNLPHNATITQMTVYCAATATGMMDITMYSAAHGADTSSTVASVNTSGASGSALTLSTAAITNPQIDNLNNHYYIRIFSSAWPGDSTRWIKSVLIEYTTAQPD